MYEMHFIPPDLLITKCCTSDCEAQKIFIQLCAFTKKKKRFCLLSLLISTSGYGTHCKINFLAQIVAFWSIKTQGKFDLFI